MMARPIIQVTLALLLTLVYIQTLKGGVQAEQIEEIEDKSEESLLEGIEQPQWKIASEARRKNANGRQNKKPSNKALKREGKTMKDKTKLSQSKKKIRQKKIKSRKMRTNRTKLKHENKEKSRNNKKKSGRNKKRSRRNQKKSRRNQKKRIGITKKSRKGYKKLKKNREESRKNKRRSKKNQNKLNQTERKGGKHVKKLSQHKQIGNGTTCDEKGLGQKIKDFIKISNQLRKVRRIKKVCAIMENKANKSGDVFEATVNALNSALGSSSGRRVYLSRSRWRRSSECKEELTGIKDKLKNCSKSAKAKCQKSSVEACQNETQLTTCENELLSWLNKFGPATGSCLQASDNYCTCITALQDVSKDCLGFDKKSTMAINSKKKCTSGDEEGSFGFCKKLQAKAAEKGPGAANCQNTGVVTTRKPPSITLGRAECYNSTCHCQDKCGSNYLSCKDPHDQNTLLCCTTDKCPGSTRSWCYPDVKVKNSLNHYISGVITMGAGCSNAQIMNLAPGATFTHDRGCWCLLTGIYVHYAEHQKVVNCQEYSSSGTSYSNYNVVDAPGHFGDCKVERV